MPEQQLTPTADETQAWITARMKGILTPKGINTWWATPIDALGGDTPQQMLDAGQCHTLHVLVEGYYDTSFT